MQINDCEYDRENAVQGTCHCGMRLSFQLWWRWQRANAPPDGYSFAIDARNGDFGDPANL